MKKSLIALTLLLLNTSFAYEPVITQQVAGKEELNAKLLHSIPWYSQ